MCKLIGLSNTKLIPVNKLHAFTMAANKSMASERDGFGFAAYGEHGVWGEKMLDVTDVQLSTLKKTRKLDPFMVPKQQVFGKPSSKPTGAFIVHGRTSTNKVDIHHTHPFMDSNWTMVHNGIVRDLGNMKTDTTCDSELILRYYTQGGIDEVARNVSGYYAVLGIDNKTGNLIVIRDSTASLCVAYIQKYKCYVFGTTADLIKSACKAMGINKLSVYMFTENTECTFINDEEYSYQTFTPQKQSFGYLDQKSIGENVGLDFKDWRDPYETDYIYKNKYGIRISERDYDKMSSEEQSECNIYDRNELVFGRDYCG